MFTKLLKMAHKIEIDKYRESDSIVLSGRPKGEDTRAKENLDEVDKKREDVIVSIPTDLKIITSSFLLGLLGDSIRLYGREDFLDKYKFEGKDIQNKLENCINVALNSKSPF